MVPALAQAATYYVSKAGSDNYTCTQAQSQRVEVDRYWRDPLVCLVVTHSSLAMERILNELCRQSQQELLLRERSYGLRTVTVRF